MHDYKKLLFGLILCVFLIGFGSSAECNADLTGIVNGTCTVSTSLTLNGTYIREVNGSIGSPLGAIIINGNNLIFDLNGTTIFGNITLNTSSPQDTRGIFATAKQNFTIRNGIVRGYNIGSLLRFGSNITVENMTFTRNKFNLQLQGNNNQLVLKSKSNESWQHGFYLIGNSNFTSLLNNTLSDEFIPSDPRLVSSLEIQGGDNYIIQYNNISNFGQNRIRSTSPTLKMNNITFMSNYLFNSTGPSAMEVINVSNTTFTQNYFDLNSKGLYFSHSSNSLISYNNISRSITNYDEWNIGIVIDLSNNFTISNNNLSNMGSAGVILKSTNNTNISSNYIDRMSDAQQIANGLDGQSDFSTGIGILQLYYTFAYFPASHIANPNASSFPLSYNNIVLNNQFGQNIQTYLYLQGAQNTSYSVPNYWYTAFQSPNYLVNKTELFNNLDYQNLSNIKDSIYNTRFGQGYGSSFQGIKIFYNISKDYYYFKNRNLTAVYQTEIFNLTNGLCYYENNTLCASSDISSNTNFQFNTFGDVIGAFVLPYFNLTEGVTRQFSPLSISGTSTSKTITSTLSQAINATVVVSVSTCTFTSTYKGSSVSPQSCSNRIATFNLNEIPSGSSSLLLDYNPTSYDCNGSTSTLANGITSLIPLAIILMVFMIFASLGLFTLGDGISTTVKSTIYILTASTFVGLAIILAIGSIIVGSLPC